MGGHLVGIDVGGTFTDIVSHDEGSGALEVWKVPSTPADPADGILDGLGRFDDKGAIAHLRLGTTVATNTILERKGARVGYLTTAGFRDVPFIQRGNRKFHYDIAWIKPQPLVRRRDCHEVDERIDRDGAVVVPLNEDRLRALARHLRAEGGLEALAVCFLFAFIEPAHERRAAEILAQELPDVPLSLSYDVVPRWKEYERASTTIADAYLKPRIGRYLARMEERLRAAGLARGVVVIKSNGGETTLEAAARAPVHMTVSGPTGGVVGACHLARLLGRERLVSFDMGGTSTDCSAIQGATPAFTTSFEIEWGIPIQVPMIDVRTLGAGGGSIAWIDKGGLLRVGPRSAGAEPGPACYGKGGQEATVTDANLVLGRINPDNFLGGAMRLEVEAARVALARLGERLGLAREEAALAVVRIVNVTMMGALRAVLMERGLDPRQFALLAFGGAGPLHAVELMREAGIREAVVPNHPGQFSAYGFILADPRVDRHRTLQQSSRAFDPARAGRAMAELVDDALGELRAQGHGARLAVRRALEMRYVGQNYELEVEVAGEDLAVEGGARLWQAFHDLHRARYGFDQPGNAIEIVNLMVTATAATEKPALPSLATAERPPLPVAERRVVFADGAAATPVFRREDLRAGHRLDGPALVEEPASVTVLPPGARLAVDGFGHLLLET